jgi:hypothetical protein
LSIGKDKAGEEAEQHPCAPVEPHSSGEKREKKIENWKEMDNLSK